MTWPTRARDPIFLSNALLSLYFALFLFVLLLPFITVIDSDLLGPIPLVFGVLLMIFNHYFFIKSGKLIEIESKLDRAPRKKKYLRWIIFFGLILALVFLFKLSSWYVEDKKSNVYLEKLKQLERGMLSFEVTEIMGDPTGRYINVLSPNDSVYYYRFSKDSISGVEIYFNQKTGIVRRVFYLY